MNGLSTLITGIGGPAGRAVSEYLDEHGVSFLGADMRPLGDPESFRLLPAAADDRFIGELEQVLDREKIKLLVPTVTEELPKVSGMRDAIRRKGCAVFVSPLSAILIANDKWLTAAFLRSYGISVPRSYCGTSRQELMGTIPFPILSKPRVGRGGRGIMIHQDDADLPSILSKQRIYQEFLPGAEYDVNLFAGARGNPRVSVVLEKTALKDGLFGNAVQVRRVDEPEIAKLAEEAVRALSLEGPIDMDIRRGGNGKPAILEINARVGANVRSAEEILLAMISRWRSRS